LCDELQRIAARTTADKATPIDHVRADGKRAART
jgi:hypothetical protein